MEIGSAKARTGAITRGRVELGFYPDGPMSSPVVIASGRHDGPVLWVQGSVHGPEIVGTLAMQRFLGELDVGALKGTVVCLMVANPLGFRGFNRLTPHDGVNLNRVFPGDPGGTFTEQLAFTLLELALKNADALLDLHSGGDLTITCHYTLCHDDGSAAGVESARLARCTGAPNVWNSMEESLKGCAFTNFVKAGKPGVIVERGGGARVEEADILAQVQAITGVCRGLGMLPGEPQRPARFRLGGDAVHLKCRRGGLFHALVAPGDDLVKCQPVGHVVDLYGDIVETPVCPLDNAWVGSIRRPYMPVYNGDQVTEIVGTRGYEDAGG